MLQHNGEVGLLVEGDKQIAGFLDWTINIGLERTGMAGQWPTIKVSVWNAIAERWWLTEKPLVNILTARFFKLLHDRLILIVAEAVRVDLPADMQQDIILTHPLRMVKCG